MRALYIATIVLFIQQTLTAMSRLVVPVMAPILSEALGWSPSLVGVYSAMASSLGVVLALVAGGFVRKFGAWRMCQITLVTMGTGIALCAPGWAPLFVVSAFLIGTGPPTATPASSHVLSRFCPADKAPLFFSIKQTGVPMAGVLAGMTVPALALAFGWRAAFVITGGAYLLTALLMQPWRTGYDDDRDPTRTIGLGDIGRTLRAVTRTPELRDILMAACAFVGLQAMFDTFFVLFLTHGLGYGLVAAGGLFAAAQGVALVTRILWGWVAGRWVSPRVVLAWLGLVMAAASMLMGAFGGSWPQMGLMIVACIYTGTAFSWHGVLLAEAARLAPKGDVGTVVGGVLAFILSMVTLYPLMFSGILELTGENFGVGYVTLALPALVVGSLLLFRRR